MPDAKAAIRIFFYEMLKPILLVKQYFSPTTNIIDAKNAPKIIKKAVTTSESVII